MVGKIQPLIFPAAARLRESRKHRAVRMAPEDPKIHRMLVSATLFPGFA